MPQDPPLRIAFLIPTFPEVSNTFILNQITGLLDRGHDVDIFAIAVGDYANAHPDVERYRLVKRMRHLTIPAPRARRAAKAAGALIERRRWHPAVLDALNPRRHGRHALNLERLYTAISFLASGPYDVLHCQFGNLGPSAQRLVSLGAVRAKLVTSFRGADATVHLPAAPHRFRELFDRGDLFLPVSQAFRERLLAAGAPEDRIMVHHSGIALDRFRFRPRRPPADEPPTLLFVGRLTEKKGVRYALEALARARAVGREARLTIIGDGHLSAALRRRSSELGLDDRVRFAGAQPQQEVVAAMHAAHLMIAPSVTGANGEQEGIPNVLKEAMATGMPVVSTRHSGIPELVEHGRTGLLAPEADVEALTGHLIELLDHPERWLEMGRAGRAKVAADFDIETLNDELEQAYRGLALAESPPEAGREAAPASPQPRA